LYSGDK